MQNVPAYAHSELPSSHKSNVSTTKTAQAFQTVDHTKSNKESQHQRQYPAPEDEMDEFSRDFHEMGASWKCYVCELVLYTCKCEL